jgi:hypothetical protein
MSSLTGTTLANRAKALKCVEDNIILNLAQGYSDAADAKIRNKTNSVVPGGVTDASFATQVLLNNTAMDTPNVAMMSYLVDGSFVDYSFNSPINSSGTIFAPVYDISTTSVVVNEHLRMELTDKKNINGIVEIAYGYDPNNNTDLDSGRDVYWKYFNNTFFCFQNYNNYAILTNDNGFSNDRNGYRSSDGVSWYPIDYGDGFKTRGVAFGNDKYVATGRSNDGVFAKLITSSNGTSWTENTWFNNLFGGGNGRYYRSSFYYSVPGYSLYNNILFDCIAYFNNLFTVISTATSHYTDNNQNRIQVKLLIGTAKDPTQTWSFPDLSYVYNEQMRQYINTPTSYTNVLTIDQPENNNSPYWTYFKDRIASHIFVRSLISNDDSTIQLAIVGDKFLLRKEDNGNWGIVQTYYFAREVTDLVYVGPPGQKKFYALNQNMYSSVDGLTWTNLTPPVNPNYGGSFPDLIYQNGYFFKSFVKYDSQYKATVTIGYSSNPSNINSWKFGVPFYMGNEGTDKMGLCLNGTNDLTVFNHGINGTNKMSKYTFSIFFEDNYDSMDWNVSFPDTANRNFGRAVNSSLIVRNNDASFNPITVSEPSFNTVFACAGQGNDAFNYYWNEVAGKTPTQVNYSYPNNKIVNPAIGQSANERKFSITSRQNLPNPIFKNETGTFAFILNGGGAQVLSSPSPSTSSFLYVDVFTNSAATPLFTDMSLTLFNNLFPNVTSDVSFVFDISATSSTGGYGNPTANGIVMCKLDSTGLTNNYPYMKNFVNKNHSLIITNSGDVIVDVSSNSYSPTKGILNGALIKTNGEKLKSEVYLKDGRIELDVQKIDERVTDQNSSNKNINFVNSVDIQKVVVAYDQSDNNYLLQNTPYSANLPLISFGSISDSMKTTDDVSFSAMKLFDGVRDSSYCYVRASGGFDNNCKALTSAVSNNVMMYANHNLASSQFEFSANDIPSNASILFVNASGYSKIFDPSNDGLYNLVQGQNGEYPNGLQIEVLSKTAGANTFTDVSKNIGFKLTKFINPTVTITNFNLSNLAYDTYRILLLPKTLNDLIAEGDLSGSSGIHFQYGKYYLNQQGTLAIDESTSPNYLLMSRRNFLNFNLQSDEAGYNGYQGIKVLDILGAVDDANVIRNANATKTYTYTLTFDFEGALITFEANNSSDIKTNALRKFDLRAIIFYHEENNTIKFVARVPIGSYDNLCFSTNDIPKQTLESGSYTETITFTQQALLGLKGYLQGGYAQNSPNFKDVSNNWNYINGVPKFHVDQFSQLNTTNETNKVMTFKKITTQTDVSFIDPRTQLPGTGTLNINLDFTANILNTLDDLELFQPGYTIQLTNDLDTSFKVSGRYFTDADLDKFIDKDYQLFNPANINIGNTNQSNLLKGTNLQNETSVGTELTFDVSATLINDFYTRRLSVTSSTFKFTLDLSFDVATNFNLWYCPQDIWQSSNSILNRTEIVRSSRDNCSTVLTSGIALYDTRNSFPGSYVTFNLANQNISINPISGTSLQNNLKNRYDLASPQKLTRTINNLGLDVSSGLQTVGFNLSQYRGYHSNDPSQLDKQYYSIKRTPATFVFDISGVQTVSYNLYTDRSITGITFGSPINSFGLSASEFLYSILPTGSPTNYSIIVTGDSVNVFTSTTTNTGPPDTSNIQKNLKNDVILYQSSYAAKNSSIVAGRVRAAAGTEYRVQKDVGQIYAYSCKDMISGDPKYNLIDSYTSRSYWLIYPNNIDVNTNTGVNIQLNKTGLTYYALFNGGINLTPSIKISLNKGLYCDIWDGTVLFDETGYGFQKSGVLTSLVSSPPRYTFTALSRNVYTTLGRMSAFDISSTWKDVSNSWTVPAFDTTSPLAPYAGGTYGKTVSNLDSLLFYRKSTFPQGNLGTTVCSNQTNPQSLSVFGNNALIQEQINGGASFNLYNSLIQNLPTSFGKIIGNADSNLQNVSCTGPDLSLGYTFSYNQNGAAYQFGIVNSYVGNPFCTGTFDISINVANPTHVAIYSVVPFIDASGSYQLEAYKFLNSTGTNFGLAYSESNTSPLKYVQYGTSRGIRKITVPNAVFNSTSFNINRQRGLINLTDVSNSSTGQLFPNTFIPDPSFNSGFINFNLTALSTLGNSNVRSLFNTLGPISSWANVRFFNLPDLYSVVSPDGSPLFRVTYNGSVSTAMLSTSMVRINPISEVINNNNVNTIIPNVEMPLYNTSTFEETFDSSNNVYTHF